VTTNSWLISRAWSTEPPQPTISTRSPSLQKAIRPGMKELLRAVCLRLSGKGGEVSSIIRLGTQYGGGKTHALIALVHAVRGVKGVANLSDFVDPSILPTGTVRIAALDGENADPANGLTLEPGLLAHSMWGEMAYRLAGRSGYERVRQSDEKHIAPGADTIRELFGGQPTLILLDEVSVYLRKVERAFPDASKQFAAFIHDLFKAVASTPQVALVYTLAIGKDDQAKDAYKEENERAAAAMAEAESVAVRSTTPLNPTEEDETPNVLRARLFESVDLKASNLLASTKRQIEVAVATRSNLGFVMGGQQATRGEVPYQAAVVLSFYVPEAKNGYHCGGVLLNRAWVLTAGHCFQESTEPVDFQVYLGSLKLSTSDQPNICCWSPVEKLVRYPGYREIDTPSLNGTISRGDVALLKLANPPTLSADIATISAVDSTIEKALTGTIGQVSGWGVTTHGGGVSDDLMVGQVSVLPDAVCPTKYNPGIIDPTIMKCSPAGQVGACQGDSGGPLVMKSKGTPYVEGIVSWGYPVGGCPSTKPNVYSRVSAFSTWIAQCIAGGDCPSEIKPHADPSGSTK